MIRKCALPCLCFTAPLLLVTACTSSASNQISNGAASAGEGGIESAAWNAYRNARTVGERPFIDFSSAGVNYGERAIPDISSWKRFSVADYGAIADDGQDDTKAIQATIRAAQLAGGGVIQFASGRYILNSDPNEGSITITASNIVLQGSNNGQTILVMANPMPPASPGKKWSGPAMIIFRPANASAPSSRRVEAAPGAVSAINQGVAVGEMAVTVTNASLFAAGDYVSFDMESPKANARFLKGRRLRDIWSRIRERGVMLREKHRIKAVQDGRLLLEQPLLTPLDADLPWQVRKVEMLENVGFENICFEGNFTEKFKHHKNATHDSGHRAVELSHTAHSWVRNSCFRNVSNAVSIKGGLANSVLLNVIEGNGGHYAFQSEFGTRNLIGLNMDITDNGQFHGPSVSHMSVGTVIWRYIGAHAPGIDLHGTFPRNTLFDNISMAGFGNWGGNYKDLPNHLDGLVLWSFFQTGERVGNHYKNILDFWQLPESDDQLYGFLTAVNPIIVGYDGPVTQVNRSNARVENLEGKTVPISLYEAQLERRLGERPLWMEQVLQKWDNLISEHSP